MITTMGRFCLLVLLGALAFGCSANDPQKVQSVTGHLDRASFPYDVTELTVQGQKGQQTVSVAADGSFELALRRGGAYRVWIPAALASSDSALLVFPRSSGSLDRSIRASHVGAPFDMGRVRFVGAVPAEGLTVHLISQQADGQQGDTDVECEDGVDPATGALCVEDDDQQECGGGDDEGEDDEADDDGEDAGEEDGEGDDFECEQDGEHEGDNEGCDVDAEDADVAVAEHNLPEGGVCEGEDDDVDCEQEGEHEGDNEGC